MEWEGVSGLGNDDHGLRALRILERFGLEETLQTNLFPTTEFLHLRAQ